jgi:hypothetical protein
MQAYRVEKVIPQTGKIELDALPFAAGAVVEIIVLGTEREENGWQKLAVQGLSRAYGNDEPDYSAILIKEPNPENEGRH